MMAGYNVGDVVRLKKQHPCGGFEWRVTRVGVDFRMTCTTCGRSVMVPRVKFEKAVKSIVSRALPEAGDAHRP